MAKVELSNGQKISPSFGNSSFESRQGKNYKSKTLCEAKRRHSFD